MSSRLYSQRDSLGDAISPEPETSTKTIFKNRLQSIIYDALFVQSVVAHPYFRYFPLIPNERCGLWYVPTFLHGVISLTSEASLARTAAPLVENPDQPLSFAKSPPTSYFKSTDGHINEWQFSLRRLNLHLLPVLAKYGGIISVDSTRKGKVIPDSLSKTIPIWCAVLNSIMYEDEPLTSNQIKSDLGLEGNLASVVEEMAKNRFLWCPQEVISREEFLSIVDKIPQFVDDVKRLNLVTKESLVKALGGKRKPIVPSWVHPRRVQNDSKVEALSPMEGDFTIPGNVYSIVCVTASLSVRHGEATMELSNENNTARTTWDYVQGSGDDHELWATRDICGGKLSPKFFWDNIYYSKSKVNHDIIDQTTGYIHEYITENVMVLLLESIAEQVLRNGEPQKLDVTYVKNTSQDTGIWFGRVSSDVDYNDFVREYPKVTRLIMLSDKFEFNNKPNRCNLTLRHFRIGSTKKASRQLRGEVIGGVITLRWCHNKDEQVMVLCETGTDISAGIVVMFLTYYFDIDWNPYPEEQSLDHFINKDLVKRHLSKLNEIKAVNPSRNTLQSIHEFLMPFGEVEHKGPVIFRLQ